MFQLIQRHVGATRGVSSRVVRNFTVSSFNYEQEIRQPKTPRMESTTPILTTASLKIIPRKVELTALEKQDETIRKQRKLSKQVVEMKRFKPRAPSLKWYSYPIYNYLHKGGPYRPLTFTKKKNGGRNDSGKITIRHRGGGYKRRIRVVDFKRLEAGKQVVIRIEHDPNRTSHIALVQNLESKNLSYTIAMEGMRAGDQIESFRQGIPKELVEEMGGEVDPALLAVRTNQKGNCLPIHMIPIGAVISNIGEKPYEGAKYCRAAGAYGRLIQKVPEKSRAIVKLQSGEQRYVHIDACATLGVVSNAAHQHSSMGKAGRKRNLGWRPTVSGTSMNKCDHPHGGGRGRSKSNKTSRSKWGVLAKCGFKTRKGKSVNTMKVKDRPRGKARA